VLRILPCTEQGERGAEQNCITENSSHNFKKIKSRKFRYSDHAACMGEKRTTREVLVRIPEGKRGLEKAQMEL
jgi:hypothetical protein